MRIVLLFVLSSLSWSSYRRSYVIITQLIVLSQVICYHHSVDRPIADHVPRPGRLSLADWADVRTGCHSTMVERDALHAGMQEGVLEPEWRVCLANSRFLSPTFVKRLSGQVRKCATDVFGLLQFERLIAKLCRYKAVHVMHLCHICQQQFE